MSSKNRLTFGGYPVLDTDSGSLFYFPRHCRMGLFRRFISIFDTVDWPLFTKHGEMTDKRMNPLNVKIDPADIRIRINRKSESESRITFGGGFVEVVGLRQPLRMMSPMMSPSASRFIVYILGIWVLCMTKPRSIPNCYNIMNPHGLCDLPLLLNSLFHDTNLNLARVHFESQHQKSGIYCLLVSVILHKSLHVHFAGI